MIFGLLAGSFLACGDKDTTEETVEEAACETVIDETNPASGAADFYILNDIVFELNEEDTTAVLSLVDASGAAVSGTSSVDGSTITFTPDAALAPSTGYTASLSYCHPESPADIAFTTSDLGSALSGSIAGNTYAVDISSGTFVKPAGVGALLGDAFSNNILIGILDDSGDALEVRGAISIEGVYDQDMCSETLDDFPAADFSDSPYFEIPEGDLTLTLMGFTATIYDLSVSGMFAADGSYFGGGELRGNLDARDLVNIIADLIEVESADDICGLVAGFGVPCEPCTDGEVYCVGVEVVDLVAQNTNTEVVPVTADDIAANAECAQD